MAIMPHISDPTERAIIAGFQRAVDNLARAIAHIESIPEEFDDFDLARCAFRYWHVQAGYICQVMRAFRSRAGSADFLLALDALAELAADAVPDYPGMVDWDGEWAAMNGESA